MSTYEAVRYNFNGSALTNIVAIEVGTILPWSNSTLPSGYLNCDGTAVSRSTYSALFAIIGTDYGSGNGSSTFNLPDLQDKVPVGVSGSKAVASSAGATTVTPTGSITAIGPYTSTDFIIVNKEEDFSKGPYNESATIGAVNGIDGKGASFDLFTGKTGLIDDILINCAG